MVAGKEVAEIVSCEGYHARCAVFLAGDGAFSACPSCCISLHFTDIGSFSTMVRCLLSTESVVIGSSVPTFTQEEE